MAKPTSKTSTKKSGNGARARAVASAPRSDEERAEWIRTAAYFMAEREGFAGDPLAYWVAAEREIDGRG